MQKRIISLIVVLCLVGIIVFIFIRLKQSNQTFENSAFETIPQNAVVLVDIKKANSLEQFVLNDMWFSFSALPLHAPMLSVANCVQTAFKDENQRKNFANNSLVVSFMNCNENSNDYIISVPLLSIEQINQAHNLLQNVFSNCKKTEYSFDYKSQIFNFENSASERICSYAILKNTLIISPSHILVEAAITSCREEQNILGIEDFKKIKRTASKQTVANAYVNLAEATQFFMPITTPAHGSWTEFDIIVRNNSISLNGFSLSNNFSDFLSVFQAQEPVKLELSAILPANTSYFKMWGLSNITQFRAHYDEFLKANNKFERHAKQLELLNETFQSNVANDIYNIIDSEIAFVCGAAHESNDAGNHYAIIKTISQSQAEEIVNSWLQSYGDSKNTTAAPQKTNFTLDNKTIYSIYRLPKSSIPAALWSNLFAEMDFPYISFVDNYMIFANSHKALEKLITAFELKKVLANDMEFKKFQNSVLPSFNSYEYAAINAAGNAHTLIGQIKSEEIEISQRSNALAAQMAVQDGMFYNNMSINFAQDNATSHKTTAVDNIVWESVLDAEIATQPQIFEIQPGEFGIFVQDVKNTLYLLNNAGKIQWRKSLKEPLISPLFRVDYFKNGKYQYLANSQNYVYCIDRLGNYVENYPHKLEESSNVAMSVFDYEKTKEYRLFVPCGKKLFLYNIKMQKIKDWLWNECESNIVAPIQHFVQNKKDYIVCADQRNVYLLNRKGELRSKASEQFEKSPQTLWYYQPKTQTLVSTDVNASIKAMNFDGKVHTLLRDTLPKNHYFLCSQNECVLVVDKKCSFYTSQAVLIKEYELDFAVEIAPKIIKNSPITLGILDKQNKKMYFCDIKTGLKPQILQGTTGFTSGKLQRNQQKNSIIIGGAENSLVNFLISE